MFNESNNSQLNEISKMPNIPKVKDISTKLICLFRHFVEIPNRSRTFSRIFFESRIENSQFYEKKRRLMTVSQTKCTLHLIVQNQDFLHLQPA